MKVIIAGSRTVDKYRAFYEALTYLLKHRETFPIDEMVTGCCPKGADQVPYMIKNSIGESMETPVIEFPADWDTHGKSAGFKRNIEMAEYADALLLVWDGKSRGSAHMKNEMEKRRKEVHEVIV